MKQANYDTMKNLYDNGYRTVDMCKIFTSLIVTSSRTTYSASEVFLDLFTNNGEKTLKELNDNYSSVKSITSHLPIDAEVASELLLKAEDIDVEIDPTPIRQFTIRQKIEQESTAITYTFEYTSNDGCWCSRNRPSRAIIIVEGTNLSMIKVKGVDPTFYQASAMLIEALSRSASIHKYNRCDRIWPFKINKRIGYSDCEDWFLDLYRREGSKFVKRNNASNLHISMADKVSDVCDIYVGDILEMIVAAGCYREGLQYKDFDFIYCKDKKRLTRNGIRFVRPYKNEVFHKEDMDFIPTAR